MKRLVLLLCVSLALGACDSPPPAPTVQTPPAPAPKATKAAPVVQRAPEPRKPAPAVGDARALVLKAAQSAVGTVEKTGHNDGPLIESMQRLVGIRAGADPYCAAFNFWSYHTAGQGAAVPRSGWSPDWVAKPTWTATRGGTTPRPADSWGIYFAKQGRVAHTGLVKEWKDAASLVITIEANTSPQAASGEADRNGDGIWSKRRPLRQIYAARAWLP